MDSASTVHVLSCGNVECTVILIFELRKVQCTVILVEHKSKSPYLELSSCIYCSAASFRCPHCQLASCIVFFTTTVNLVQHKSRTIEVMDIEGKFALEVNLGKPASVLMSGHDDRFLRG